MHSLHLTNSNSIQQREEEESLSSVYNVHAPTTQPLAAPVPTRISAMPPQVSPGMWSPELGIKFGDPSPGPQGTGSIKPGQWDPNQGVRFG